MRQRDVSGFCRPMFACFGSKKAGTSDYEFIDLVASDQPEAPGSFVHDAILNRMERASLDESMA